MGYYDECLEGIRLGNFLVVTDGIYDGSVLVTAVGGIVVPWLGL